MKRALRGNNVVPATEPIAAEGRLAKVVEVPLFNSVGHRRTYLTLLVAGISLRTTVDLGAFDELQHMADIINAAVETKIQQALEAREREAAERLNRQIQAEITRLAEELSRDPFTGDQ